MAKTKPVKKMKERHKITVEVEPPKPKKKLNIKHDSQFKPGNEYRWKPGQSGNPSGRPKGTGVKIISQAYRVRLEDKCTLPGYEDLTWAEAIAMGQITSAAMGDTPAAKEIREVTEGRLPETLNLEGKIDYTAGQSAKELLLAKLGGEKK